MQINANHHAQYLALQVLDVCPEPQTTTVCQGLGPGHPQRSFRIMIDSGPRYGMGLAAWQPGRMGLGLGCGKGFPRLAPSSGNGFSSSSSSLNQHQLVNP
jgi:hypothetical protein